MSDDLDFIHRYEPGEPEKPTLLLLHGTGGNEEDLLPFGRNLLSGAGLLSPRGKVLERGMPRFFKRLGEGVFDLDDLAERTAELAGFVEKAARAYGFAADRVVGVGFSNGANIAGSLMLTRPELLAGAVLIRPMVPFDPEGPIDLGGRPVLILSGDEDPMVPAEEAERLVSLLNRAGADVTYRHLPGGHSLSQADADGAAVWLAKKFR